MAKTGKLTKLKSAIKRWPSFSKLTRTNISIAAATTDYDQQVTKKSITAAEQEEEDVLRAVYVGKARRRYLLTSDILCHPLFQELIDRSSGHDEDGEVVVACEVVLFEHLLWMLQSAGGSQLGSMEELAEFYHTC